MNSNTNPRGFFHYISYAFILLAVLAIASFAVHNEYIKHLKNNALSATSSLAEAEVVPSTPIVKKITLLAVGDIMMHQEELDATYN